MILSVGASAVVAYLIVNATDDMATRLAHICIVSSGAEGALGLSIQRGLEALGRRVTYLPYMDWLPTPKVPVPRVSDLLARGIVNLTRPAIEVRLVSALSKAAPDLVLFVKCDDLHATTYSAVRAATKVRRSKAEDNLAPMGGVGHRSTRDVPLLAYHPDDPWNQAGILRPGPSHNRAEVQLRSVDAIFLWSRRLVEKASREGAKRSFYLPFAGDPLLHPRVDEISADEQHTFGADVTFIGNWDDEREAQLGPIVDAGFDLAIWGTAYWQTRCRHPGLQKAWRGRQLFGREQAVAARASKIMLNVLRKQNKGACNMRTFEVPCTGAFMLHERSPEAAVFFPPDVACGDFETHDELIVALRRWLADPDGRARVAAEGYRRVMQWTYREWAAKLLERCEGWAS